MPFVSKASSPLKKSKLPLHKQIATGKLTREKMEKKLGRAMKKVA